VGGKLPEYMVPRVYVELEELPRTEHGKLDRKALRRVPHREFPIETISIKPRNGIEARILQIWREVLSIEAIGVKDDFFDLGGDSMKAIMLASRLGQLVNLSIPVKTIFENRTIERMIGVLGRESNPVLQTSIVPIQPKGWRPPFFCVHPAGGLVNGYIDLGRHLAPEQPFYAIQAYGAEHGQVPFTSIEEMAGQYIKDIREIQEHGPYQLGGWSLGCTIAYEMAQQLSSQREEVSFLALMDGGCNTNPIEFFQDGWEEAVETWIQDYMLRHSDLDLGENTAQFETAIQALPPEARYEFYLKTAISLDKIPPYIHPDEFRRFIHTYAINVRASRAYRPEPYPGKVTLFVTGAEENDERTAGWGRLSLGGIQIIHQPGRHHDFIYDPHVRVLAENLKDCMEQECQTRSL
jgi:thioesterase domain-containing protein